MHWNFTSSLFAAVYVSTPSLFRGTVRILLLAFLMQGTAFSQEAAPDAEAESAGPVQKDPFDLEADFIGHLLDQGLFEYAGLALEEARVDFPGLNDRIQVVEVSTLLRQGKTAEVEKILEGKNLTTDMKSQAMLLQLAMTYDAMGNSAAAMTKYQEFLKLNENKDIDDPDVLRFFASAGLRLGVILKDEGKYDEADKVLALVVKTSDDNYLKRKFLLMAAQNRMDQALTQTGAAKTETLKKAEKYTNELLWGANDNYFYMAMAMKGWMEFVRGKPEDALATLQQAKVPSIEMEKNMEEDSDAPKSEYPRAMQRYVEGLIQWDLAKKAMQNANEEEAKKQAKNALGNLYNCFLRYEGNEYADRSGLAFEDLKVWVEEQFGRAPKTGPMSPRVKELMFRRQLDLAKQLHREKQSDEAEEKLLQALGTYPDTRYTLDALDTLSRIWIAKNEEMELLALTRQIAEIYPDNEQASRIMLRAGKKMADDENLEGFDIVLRDFGRNFPSHPSAPGMLFKVATAAADRGDQGMALEIYEDILKLYPQSNFAVRVLQLRADEALKSENYDEAIKAFEQVRDQSRDPMQAAYAKLRIADSKLSSGEETREAEALEELKALRVELEQPDTVFAEENNRKQTQEFLQNVRYRVGQILLRQSGREKSDELRAQAAAELNSYLQDFPDTEQAPDVMYNLGRLYLQQGKFDEATKTFDRLASKYPASEAGKDALYSLVKAALEEGQVNVAQEAVRKMVAQPEAYEIEKIYKVAQLMVENERWEEARDSYQLVLASDRTKENDSMRQRTLNGMGNAAMGAGNLDQAAESFQKLIDEFPTSTLVMEAGVSLAELYLQKDPAEPENAKKALEAVNRILTSRRDPAGKAAMDITLGNIHMAEGNPDKALATWYTVGLLKPESEALAALVRTSITLALAEAEKQVEAGNDKRWNLIIELTDQYIKNFPMDKVTDDMRSLNVKAIQLAP